MVINSPFLELTFLHFKKLKNRETRSKTVSPAFPGGKVVENPPANAGDRGSSPGPGRSHIPRSN